MNEDALVLFANDTFYTAFATRDLKAMDDLWVRAAEPTCIHPGWSPLSGRTEVMESWEAILTNPDSPAISCTGAVARILGDVAYVICYEIIDDTALAATNVFMREDQRWKMIHHQAGAAPLPGEDLDADVAVQ